MNTRPAITRAALVGVILALSGCQADFAADVTNKTSQPLFVQVFSKGNTESTLAASRRLGPGDRAVVGPVRNDKSKGAYVAFDRLPTAGQPVTIDLDAGANFFDVHQDSDRTTGPLVVIRK